MNKNRNNDIIYDALERLKKLSGLLISIDSSRKEYDAIIEIRRMQFTVIALGSLQDLHT